MVSICQKWLGHARLNYKQSLNDPSRVVIVRGLENPGGLSKGRWRVRVRVHILYPSCTLTLKEGKEGYTNTLEIFEG